LQAGRRGSISIGHRGPSDLISVVTVSELRYGANVAEWGEFRRGGLEREIARATAVDADDTLASTSAELKAACRAVGHALAQKVHDADRWIAATAIARDLDLISDDAVFEQVPGLSLVTMRSS
jgi:predicted nucleic acid-binding protein